MGEQVNEVTGGKAGTGKQMFPIYVDVPGERDCVLKRLRTVVIQHGYIVQLTL